MTLPENPIEPVQSPEPELAVVQDSDAPVSVVPHDAAGRTIPPVVRFRSNRYGELDEHELIRLLDSIEDERARARFRESIYISVFFWLAVALVVLFGPKYLWHAPQLINPGDAIRAHELTQLNMPVLRHAPPPAPKLDRKTAERLRASEPPPAPTSAPVPTPAAPAPAPAVAPTPTPAAPLPAAPQPTSRPAPPVDAPTPQPSANRPNFGSPTSASDNMKNLLHGTPGRSASSGDYGSMPTGKGADVGGGVEVLSDMQGVDFGPYLRRMHDDVMRNWIPLLPEETEAPILKHGETYIILTILPGGVIGDMKFETSTGDKAIDKAAWGSILSEGQFPPLPKQFHGPSLILRLHYSVNGQIR